MENPPQDIISVVHDLTATKSPIVQRLAVETYFSREASFRHPVCVIPPGPNSRDHILGVYQWYRILSPQIESKVESVVFDADQQLLYLEVVQWFGLFFLPIKPAPARLTIRLQLWRDSTTSLYHIISQEDFYHPDDFIALLFPLFAPLIRLLLALSGILTPCLAYLASILGVAFGLDIWPARAVDPSPYSGFSESTGGSNTNSPKSLSSSLGPNTSRQNRFGSNIHGRSRGRASAGNHRVGFSSSVEGDLEDDDGPAETSMDTAAELYASGEEHGEEEGVGPVPKLRLTRAE